MLTAGDLVFTLRADKSQLNKALGESEKGVKKFGDKLSAWTIAKGKIIGDFATNAITNVNNVVESVMKNTIKAYGTFEQLEGGAKLLFGSAFEKIMDNAAKAFETVQMSANDYLDAVNGYAVGLKNSLDGDEKAAADLADKIITAQADIVAATGKSRESVQNAFAGVMRGNYMMLDNLGLGIKGSKEGMEDVIKSVNEWHKANKRTTKYMMGNLADMENALVDYVEMQGLAGYAGKEAADTLEGTMASTKAAWQNLLVALGSGKDVKKATRNFGRTLTQTVKNIRPVVLNAIHGIFESAKVLFPELKALFKETFTAVKLQVADWLDLGSDASWIDIGIKLAGKIKSGAKSSLIDWLELGDDASWIEIGSSALEKVKKGAKTRLIDLFGLADLNGNKLGDDATWGDVGKSISEKLSESLSDGGWLDTALKNVSTNLTAITEFASKLIIEISKWLSNPDNMKVITDAIVGITNALVGAISTPEFQAAIGELANSLIEAIKKLLPTLLDAAKNIWQGLNTESKVVVGGLLINNLLKGLGQGGILATIGKTLPKALPLLGTAGKAILGSAAGAPLIGSILSAGAFYAIAKGASANNYTYRGKYDPTRYSEREDAQYIQTAVRGLLGSSTSNGKWQFGNLAAVAKTAEEFIGLFDYVDEKGGTKNWLMSELGAGDEMKQAAIAEIMATAFGKGSWRNLPKEQQRLLESGYEEYTKQGGRNIDYTSLMAGAQKFFEDHGVFDEKGMWTIPIVPEVPSGTKESIEASIGTLNIPANVVPNITNVFGYKKAKGDWNVPYDNYPALLHRNEMVLTASQARRYRDGEMNADYGIIGEMIGTAINQSMKKVYVMMSGEKVGDLTTKRVRKNINASTYSKTRAMGG